jgi:cytochrome c5/cytochrome c551/c552
MSDEHTSFIKTPKQLIVVVALAFAVPIALIVLLSQLVTGVRPGETEDTEAGVLNRIKPVGEVTLADASAPKGDMTGEQLYQTVCKTCHEAGVAGAPRIGDKAAWAPRIKQGVDQLYAHAIGGTAKGMPAKGGNPDLTDVEMQRGVVYMANRSGASFKEPPAPASPASAAGGAPVAASAPAAPGGTAQPAAAPMSKSGSLDTAGGQALMQKDGCAACHAIDKKLVGPAYQDVAAKYKDDKGAAVRLAQKVKAGGAGVWGQIPMPANAAVSDDDIKALVAWILSLKK